VIDEADVMIRIKCPKCSFPLAVEDDQAGKPGDCTQCGSKFRIPMPKATVRDDNEKGRPGRRRDDDDDDDEDEADDRPRRRRRAKAWKMSTSARMNIQMSIALLCTIIVLGVASCYIPALGVIMFWAGLFWYWACTFMIARMAWEDGFLTFILVWYTPYFFIYVVKHWDRTQRLVISSIAMFFICMVGMVGTMIYVARLEIKREIIRQRIKDEGASIVRVYRDA
jgi:hypothetical protein